MSENENEQLNYDFEHSDMLCYSLETMAKSYERVGSAMDLLTKDYMERASQLIKCMKMKLDMCKADAEKLVDTIYIPDGNVTEKLQDLNAKRAEKGLPPV